MIRCVSLNAQHVLVAALQRHAERFPDSKIIPSMIDKIAAPFPVIFIADTVEDAKLLCDGMGDMCEIVYGFPEEK